MNCAREDERADRADCGDKDSDQTLKKILTNEENIAKERETLILLQMLLMIHFFVGYCYYYSAH